MDPAALVRAAHAYSIEDFNDAWRGIREFLLLETVDDAGSFARAMQWRRRRNSTRVTWMVSALDKMLDEDPFNADSEQLQRSSKDQLQTLRENLAAKKARHASNEPGAVLAARAAAVAQSTPKKRKKTDEASAVKLLKKAMGKTQVKRSEKSDQKEISCEGVFQNDWVFRAMGLDLVVDLSKALCVRLGHERSAGFSQLQSLCDRKKSVTLCKVWLAACWLTR
eukprot:s3581_g2.t1